MIGRFTGRAAVALTLLAHWLGCHVYLSTSCLHGEHSYCRSNTGLAGAKRPASCKFCGAMCVCRCHRPEGST